jgi:8-hydroxy-5-deazaflavin:NADPH oxidoreductase
MKIAIIGTGNIGGTLAKKLSSVGHEIYIGVRNTNEFKGMEMIRQIPDVHISEIHTAAQNAEVIIIATPAHIVVDLIKSLGDLSQKVVIDTTNSVRAKPDPYENAFDAFKKLTSADVIKCFNSTGFENLSNPQYHQSSPVDHDISLDMFMAGGSEHTKTIARKLSSELGFGSCIDFGGDDKVGLLESFAICWINLAIMQGAGRDIAFKLIKRS